MEVTSENSFLTAFMDVASHPNINFAESEDANTDFKSNLKSLVSKLLRTEHRLTFRSVPGNAVS